MTSDICLAIKLQAFRTIVLYTCLCSFTPSGLFIKKNHKIIWIFKIKLQNLQCKMCIIQNYAARQGFYMDF